LRALVAAAMTHCLVAHAQVKIGVITSATGPTSFVGSPQKNSVALLPKKVGETTIAERLV
jgi:branched-chain amino acid transport system substrate-binding protein